MSVKGRVLKIKSAFMGGVPLRNRPQLMRVMSYILSFLLGLCLSAARVFGICAPFGIGIVATSGPGMAGVFSLLGASCGYLATGGLDWGIKYVASAVLVYTASFIFQDLKIHKTNWFMPLVAAVITGLTGFLNSFEYALDVPPAILVTAELMLTGGSAYFFSTALSTQPRETELQELKYSVSILILISCALMAAADLMILDVISIGRLISVIIVMSVAFKGSLTSASAVGVAIGLAMDIAGGKMPFFSMCYGFSGLLAGVFSKHGRFLFVVNYIIANSIAVLWTWAGGLRIEALYEMFAASVIFVILPNGVLNAAGSIFAKSSMGGGESGLRLYSARRVRRLSDAFMDLFDTVHFTMEAETNDNDVAAIFDRAADIACAECENSSDCWQRNYMQTLTVMNDATPEMLKKRRLDREDLAPHFLKKCPSVDTFITAANSELRAMMFRRQYKIRLQENRAAAYGQYADMAAILQGVSKELSSAEGCDPLAERRLMRYLQGLEIEAKVSVFKERSGRLRACIDSRNLGRLFKEPEYLDKLSSVLGVRLCRPATDEAEFDGRLLLMEAEPLAVSVGIAAMKKKGEPVSGDRGTYFKTDQGVLCVILSDGMGSGENAAKESVATVRILERFLRSGVEPGAAMKILNSVMLLKNDEEWGYATVDLMCIDLFTGETCFYKYGAAPSYVKNGKTIRRVRGESFAAGLCVGTGYSPDIVKMKLKPGSLALVASDGVLAEDEDYWLRSLLDNFDGADTKKLAREALQGAIKEYGCEDDMTVLAVYVDRRN